jgi:hypothetical protein
MEIADLEKTWPARMSEQAGAAAARIIGLARADGIAALMDELKVECEGRLLLTISVRAEDVEGWRLSKRQEP